MSRPLHLLLVEDCDADAELIVAELRAHGYAPACQRVQTEPDFLAHLGSRPWEVIIADYRLPRFGAMRALEIVQGRRVDLPFIIVSGTIGEDVAVAAMKAGAHDYVMKGNLKRLVPAIERELREAEVRRERRRAREALLERARLSELSSDIGVAITQGTSVPDILQRAADAIIRHLDAAQADIWIHDEGSRSVTRAAVAGLPPGLTPSASAAAQLRFTSNEAADNERLAPYAAWITRERL